MPFRKLNTADVFSAVHADH